MCLHSSLRRIKWWYSTILKNFHTTETIRISCLYRNKVIFLTSCITPFPTFSTWFTRITMKPKIPYTTRFPLRFAKARINFKRIKDGRIFLKSISVEWTFCRLSRLTFSQPNTGPRFSIVWTKDTQGVAINRSFYTGIVFVNILFRIVQASKYFKESLKLNKNINATMGSD